MKGYRRKIVLFCYILVFPQVLFFLLFTVWPTIASYYFTFFNWDGFGWPTDWVGLRNYGEVIHDSMFWKALRNSMLYTLALVAFGVPATLIVAFILNSKKLRAAILFRTLFFLPLVLTSAIIGIVMSNIFANSGALNSVLLRIGLLNKPFNWLATPTTAMVILVIVGVWKSFGIKIIYWLAGLQTVPEHLYEAAKLDGASARQQFIHITIPILIPFFMVISLLTVFQGLQVFDLVRTFTNGGPFYATDVVPLYIYRNAFEMESGMPRMGFASAAGVIYGMVTMIISAGFGYMIRRTGGHRTLS